MTENTRRRTDGFTLIELLLATAILGILVGAVVSMSGSFLGYSRHVSAINTKLSDVNDAAGYVATNIRRAMRVLPGPLSLPGASTSCSMPAGTVTWTAGDSTTWPCLALVVPSVDRTSGSIVGWDLLAYRIVPVSSWTGNPGFPDGWDGNDTPVMLEYRVPLCTSSCGSVPPTSIPATATSTVSLVLGDLTFAGVSGSPIKVVGDQATATDITLTLQARSTGLESATIVPSSGPLVLRVTRRPSLGTP